MFKIRQEQNVELSLVALERFKTKAISHLRQHLPGPTKDYSDNQLSERVSECINRSKQYGLNSEQQVMCFVDATYLLNERFDSNPDHAWAAEVLNSTKLTADEKASVILWMANTVYRGEASARADQ